MFIYTKQQEENMKTVTIPKREYKELKRYKEIDRKLLRELIKGIEDIKEGRVKPIEKLSA